MIFPIKIGILTASDRCSQGKREDESGKLLKSLAETLPAEVVAYRIVPDDKETLKNVLFQMVELFKCHLILTTGGTGLGPRDQTPEATKEVIEKEISGIAEALRLAGQAKTKFAMLSRGVAGTRKKSLIINLPGSPAAVQDAFEVLRPVLRHAVELIHGQVSDCHPPLSSLSSHSHS